MTDITIQKDNFLNAIEMGMGAWAWGDRTIWQFGKGYQEQDIEEAFHAYLAAGITLVDTAEIYGSGQSEKFLGKFLKNASSRVIIATKFMPFPWRLSSSALLHSLDNSMKRIQVDHVDLYQIHWPFPPHPVEFWVKELAKVVESGKARAAGVSNYNTAQTMKAIQTLSQYNIPLASNQVEYHLLNREVEKNGLLDICKENGVRVIAWSPLAKGLLTGKYTRENPPKGLRSRQAQKVLEKLPTLISLMREIGQGHGGKNAGQVALNWVICKGVLPIPGAKNKEQAVQNAGATGWKLTPEEMSALDHASDAFHP